ncbi:MAG: NAD-glutamate dehydrogenase [Leptospiraceae bacterium]|nr:NAD-glutamate dehydrogenase [Leptospiraceae bacterium]MDW7975746.1 NAD-glutamate dehydrogenase [Leptospiraceae bacterium]
MKSKVEHELFSTFKNLMLNTIPSEYTEIFHQHDLEKFLYERWNFLKFRKNEIQVRCYNSYEVWPFHTSVIEINLKNIPFIVDTALDYLKSEGYKIYEFFNFIFEIQRIKGQIISLSNKKENSQTEESYIYIEIEKISDQKLKEIEKKIQENLKELTLMVDDFLRMKTRIESFSFQSQEFNIEKKWISEHFILMGLWAFDFKKKQNERFGIIKQRHISDAIQQYYNSFNNKLKNEVIHFKESSLISNVKRFKPLLLIFFYNQNSLLIVIGSFASKGEISPRYLIPPMKKKFDLIAEQLNAPVNNFKYKEIYKISQLIPLGILFTRNKEILLEWMSFFLRYLFTSEQKIHISKDYENQGIWVIVIEPQKYAVRQLKIQKNLENHNIKIHTFFRRTYNQFYYSFFFLKSDDLSLHQLYQFLNLNIKTIFYSWYDDLINHILLRDEDIKKKKLSIDYLLKILPEALPNYVKPKEAYHIWKTFEYLLTEKNKIFHVRFGNSISPITENDEITLNIYSLKPFYLSEVFPILESAGFQITSEVTFDFEFQGTKTYLMILFYQNQFPKEYMTKIESGLEELLYQKHTIEKTNSLLILSKLTIREIQWIKTILAYYYQVHKQYSRIYLQEFTIKHIEFCEWLMEFINTSFNPNKYQDKTKQNEILTQLNKYALKITNISEQTIALHLIEILKNIVRTNYFLNYEEITIKVLAKNLSFLKEPKPLFETFVYSSNFEGVHIRSDFIARGGIRFSDRVDDFRVEIFDLMKTQMIKNTVIVPNGAKGGFIIKKPLTPQPELVKEIYKKFIRNLLSITDNLKQKQIQKPEKVICYDSDDPFLVVAADKGTATFSDLANQISEEFHYWLFDAFASGGTYGYDHKKQGITAKGAWESVKKHFSEINIDPEKDEITVIGIGDMSGDVFGNGMLLSKTIKLIAAFNHKHVFIDPNPDPEISFKERERLFREVKGWDHYNPKLISQGGGVFLRDAARIVLSKEIQERFSIPKSEVSGEELIQYILKSKADLLWNGGIGTYIKSSQETHGEVQDPINDHVRVDAKDLQVKVIAEGGNLGLTQKARIEASQKGILLNTDFIDNSGGVDMSDHEVNLKILLNSLVQRKVINLKKRNELIRKFESEMIKRVLSNNKMNNIAISIEKIRLQKESQLLIQWLDYLSKQNVLSHQENPNLPPTNPEIAYIMGRTKLYFKNHFYKERIPLSDFYIQFALKKYFPKALYEEYLDFIIEHPLRYEIFIAYFLNQLINTLGSGHLYFIHQMSNRPFFEILLEFVHFLYLTEFDILQLYEKFYSLPKVELYQFLYELTKRILLIYFHPIPKEKLIPKSIKDFKNHLQSFLKLQPSKNQKEHESFLSAFELSLLYDFFGNGLKYKEFYVSINEKSLLEIKNTLLNLNIRNHQEYKFQYQMLKTFYQLFPKIMLYKNKEKWNHLILKTFYQEQKDLLFMYNLLADIQELISS